MAKINSNGYNYVNNRHVTIAPNKVGEYSTTKKKTVLPNGEFSLEYNSGEYYRLQANGSRDVRTKAGAIFHFKENSNAQIKEIPDIDRNRILYEVDGDDVDIQILNQNINMKNIDPNLAKYRETYESPIPVKPQKVEFIINGNRVGVTSSIKTGMELNGDNCKIITGEDSDDISIKGSSNVIITNGGDDKVSVDEGNGNNVYLGNGNDDFTAPKDSVTNFVNRNTDGWDSIKNGTDLNPYFGSFLGNLGFLGNIWGATKYAANKTADFAKTIPSKLKEVVNTTKDCAEVVGKTAYDISILGAADDYIEFQKNRPAEIEKNLEQLEKKLMNNE